MANETGWKPTNKSTDPTLVAGGRSISASFGAAFSAEGKLANCISWRLGVGGRKKLNGGQERDELAKLFGLPHFPGIRQFREPVSAAGKTSKAACVPPELSRKRTNAGRAAYT